MRWLAVAVGLPFGFVLVASGMSDYDVIHRGLLFREPHLYLMMASAIGTAAPLLVLLRRRGWVTPLGGPLEVPRAAPERRQVQGGVVFGLGWGVAGTCPGAVAAMVASGGLLGIFVVVGIPLGIALRDTVDRRAPMPAAAVPSRP